MAYTLTVGNAVGFPSPPLSQAEPIPDDVYEGTQFSFDLVYQSIGIDLETASEYNAPTDVNISSFSSTASGVTCTKINNTTLRIGGTAPSIDASDTYYKFLMPDNSVKVLPANTTEKYKALIEWSPPNNTIINASYSLTAIVTNLDNSSVDTVTSSFSHDSHWVIGNAINQFYSLLSKGTR